MSSLEPSAKAPAASRLSEEAMDLICSFVREEEDDRLMTKTLRALHLSSRQWTSSAFRALHFDPTRCLSSTHSARGAWLLLQSYVARLTGYHVQSLRHLPRVLDRFEAFNELDEIQVRTWLMSMFRLCPNIRTIGASAQDGMAWSNALHGFPRLRRLVVDPKEDILGSDGVVPFLATIVLPPSVRSLVVGGFSFDYDEATVKLVDVGLIKHLELRDFHIDSDDDDPFPLVTHHLESLFIQPGPGFHEDLRSILPPTLLSLTFHPSDLRAPPPNSYTEGLEDDYRAEVKQKIFPFLRVPLLPNLRRLTLEYVSLRLSHLEGLLLSCPHVERISFKDSTWDIVECSTWRIFDVLLARAIASIPSLTYLDLGWVPVLNKSEPYFTTEQCSKAGIELVFVPSLRERVLKEYLNEDVGV